MIHSFDSYISLIQQAIASGEPLHALDIIVECEESLSPDCASQRIVLLYYASCANCDISDYPAVMSAVDQALELWKTLDVTIQSIPYLFNKILYNKSIAYLGLAQYRDALQLLDVLKESSEIDEYMRIRVVMNMAIIKSRQRNFPEAIRLYTHTITLLQQNNKDIEYPRVFVNISGMLMRMNKFPEVKKILGYCIDKKYFLTCDDYTLAHIYLMLTWADIKEEEYEVALKSAFHLLEISERLTWASGRLSAYITLAITFYRQSEIETSTKYIILANDLAASEVAITEKSLYYYTYGLLASNTKSSLYNLELAQERFTKGLNLAIECEENRNILLILERLVELAECTGKETTEDVEEYKELLEYYREIVTRDLEKGEETIGELLYLVEVITKLPIHDITHS